MIDVLGRLTDLTFIEVIDFYDDDTVCYLAADGLSYKELYDWVQEVNTEWYNETEEGTYDASLYDYIKDIINNLNPKNHYSIKMIDVDRTYV